MKLGHSQDRSWQRRGFVVAALLVGLVLQFAGVIPARAITGVNNLTISDATINEPDSGTATMAFTVTLSPPAPDQVTVHYATSDGSAKAPGDYTATSGDLTFAISETSKTINVPIVGDTTAEPNETFTVTLSNASNASITDATGTGTITNEDGPPPALTVNDASVTEVDTGNSVNATFTVTLAPASTATVKVNYATVNGTATAPSDYVAASGTLTFTPGQTSKTVDVSVVGDANDEDTETFTFVLSNPDNASLGDAEGTGTITDNDGPPTLSVDDVAVTEGNSGTTNATFTVTLSAASGKTVVVDYATSAGTATPGVDYTETTGSLTFNPGVTTRTFNVSVIGDTLDEPNETFNVTLSNPTNATIADGTGVGTITDDDATPSLSINDVTVNEGNSGTTNAAFTVTLSAPSNQQVTVHFATSDGTATAPSDYTATSGDLTFTPGQTSKTVNVPVAGDVVDEANETFTVTLSAPSNASISDGTGTGTITDDDGAPSLSINDATVTEGNSGTTTATFTVTLSPASGSAVTVGYATASGTATAGADFEPKSGTLNFAAGETTKTIVITVYGDTLDEPDETFTVDLSSPTNATIADGSGTGTITDDDAGSSLTVNDTSVTEGNSGSVNLAFTVSLAPASAQTVTVHYATANGSATAGSDYTATSGDLTFTPGQTSKTVNVPVAGDTAPEPNETLTLNLSAPNNATIADGQGTGTILNDDGAAPTISVNDTSVTEGNSSTVNATFTVTLSAPTSQVVTVQYATADGTAKAPADYATTSGTVTFAAQDVSETFTVPVAGDTLDEANETFTVTLSAPTNATIADGSGTGTITDDDAAPTVSVNDATATEGDSGTTNATFTVTLSAASGQSVGVHFATSDGTATAADYSAASGDLTFAPGDTSKTFTVAILGDTLDEPNETFTVTLSAPSNASPGDMTGTGTITDDDATPTLSVNDVTVDEGNSGTTNAIFTVTLSAPSGQTVGVHFATSDGTAKQPGDYTTTSGDLSFSPGQNSKTFTVPVNGDTVGEPNETFNVTLSAPTNATIADGSGTGTITNDDGAIPGFSVSDSSIVEPDTGSANMVFTVTLSPASGQSTSVHYATSDGSATAGSDYTATSGDLTFAAGETTKTFSVAVTGDTTDEPNETFTVTLSAPTNDAALTDATGTGTITNNDTVTVPSRPVRVGVASQGRQLTISNGYGGAFRNEGGGLTGGPALARVPSSNDTAIALEIVVGTDSHLWVKKADSGTWARLSNSATCDESPAAVVTPTQGGGSTITVACRGSDRGLWYAQGPVDDTTLPTLEFWIPLGGGLTGGPAVALVQGTLTFMVPGTDNGHIWSRTLNSTYVPTNWACKGRPALASWDTTSYFACTGTDNGVWYARNAGSGWGAAATQGGFARGGPGLAVTPDEAVIWVRGSDDAVWQTSVSPTRGNTPFSKQPALVASEVGGTVL